MCIVEDMRSVGLRLTVGGGRVPQTIPDLVTDVLTESVVPDPNGRRDV